MIVSSIHKLKGLWLTVKAGLWFVPTVMVTTSIILAITFIEIDSWASDDFLEQFPRLFGAGSDGSRGMLTAIATSMITVAGLTFSLTITALAQASSQYTSRILRNFMTNRTNQLVLGFFVGLFSYCLVVLRTIRGGDEDKFIPSLSVLFGLVLAIVGIAVLIYFIHHIAVSIQASHIVSLAAEETIQAVHRLFPQDVGKEAPEAENQDVLKKLENEPQRLIPASASGYLQSIDEDTLFNFAKANDVVVQMEKAIGEFVVQDTLLVTIIGNLQVEDADIETLNEAFTISRYRTIHQDAAFGIRQLVDIALKALSPGVNDTTTAILSIDYLSAILAQLAQRRIEKPFRTDESGNRKVRLIAKSLTFDSFVAEAFDQIRDSAAGNTAVFIRLLVAIKTVASQTASAGRLGILLEQAKRVADSANHSVGAVYNRDLIRRQFADTLKQLSAEEHISILPAAPMERKNANQA
ncbi:DUF2254 domain-containing protein [Nibrella saemangeumensis]|uniref:DUF2254 domain-containing protein n=1 Tax=Nibrella saemangeumensis TaxID=1084526 RepID=A0ABP8NJ48_9BACT